MQIDQSDQWIRHFQQALSRLDDYWLSVWQWQFGYAANRAIFRIDLQTLDACYVYFGNNSTCADVSMCKAQKL